MVERLLLDRIHGQRRGASIAKLHQSPAFILADEAEAALPFPDVAMTRTQIAVQAAIGHRLPPAGFMDLGLQHG